MARDNAGFRSDGKLGCLEFTENHRTTGAQAVDKLARGQGLREPALTRFRLAGLGASQRDHLLALSRNYGPVFRSLRVCRFRLVTAAAAVTQPRMAALRR